MQTINAKYTETKQKGAKEVSLYIEDLPGGDLTQAEYVADPVGETPTKAEFVALRDAMVTSGVMKPAN